MADEKLNILTLAMAKKYTDNSLAGAGTYITSVGTVETKSFRQIVLATKE